MIDIVNRLRFDATRCEANFSKGVAGNITEAADEIERLRAEKLDLANHIDGCVRVAADALKRAEIAEAVCRLTRPVVGEQIKP